MNTYYTLYNTTTGAIVAMALAQSSPYTPGTGEAIVTFAANDADASLASSNPQWFLITGNPATLVMQPYWTVVATQSPSVANQWTVTATINNAPSTVPTSATFSCLGQTFTESVTSSVATWTVNLHPSIAADVVTVSVNTSGCVAGTGQVGGNAPAAIALQVYTPSGGSPTVAPVGVGSLAYLQTYYAMLMPLSRSVSDIATLIGAVVHLLIGKVIPALTGGTTPLLALTADEQNTVTDMGSAVLPYIKTTLSNAAPVPANGAVQTFDIHYAAVREDYPTVAQALEGYATDVATIPGLE